MKILVDMNLSPGWVRFLATEGFDAVHWSQVGDPRAADAAIMGWAREQGRLVFTHDLDFSAILAATGAAGPSGLQVRAQDIFPEAIGTHVVRVLIEQRDLLDQGAIVTLDEVAARVRVLPVRTPR